MGKFDFKKEYKDLYLPKSKPVIIDVPEMIFIMVDGKGDPNTCEAYKNALEVLYGLSYTIKMSKMNGIQPEGYFEYVVPPLEGLWRLEDSSFEGYITDKNKFSWTSMIRQPEFVTEDVFEHAKSTLLKKKPKLDLSGARLERFTEGLCCQVMHLGSYDDEPVSLKVMEQYIAESGFEEDMAGDRSHHEIYLNDPRKTSVQKLKTVIRHPVKKEE